MYVNIRYVPLSEDREIQMEKPVDECCVRKIIALYCKD
jgi:hypothetical protein